MGAPGDGKRDYDISVTLVGRPDLVWGGRKKDVFARGLKGFVKSGRCGRRSNQKGKKRKH